VIKTLSAQQVDVLVKYIYRAMASPATFNASSLLAWHEKAVEVGGFGSIIRCMTDRKII
jgi:actin related protein 2/3 complex subunit 5